MIASEVFNCSAPDTGNMEVIERYGSAEHKARWLPDLLEGKTRSAYLMTEPGVASSDATNIAMDAKLDGDHWVLNGEKWWSSGAGDPRCTLYVTMAVTDPDAARHARHSMFFVPADTPGITKLRAMKVYGADDAPHGHLHIRFENVRIPKDALILGRGKGFEIAQGRLGPGRIHHCMRAIGQAERALEAMCRRSVSREAFGQKLGAARRQPRHHRRGAHEHRDGAAAVPEGGLGDGHDGQPRRGAADLADQGGRAARRSGGDRPGGADARRRRRQPGFPAGAHVDQRAHAAPRRRPRRRASPRHLEGGAEALQQRGRRSVERISRGHERPRRLGGAPCRGLRRAVEGDQIRRPANRTRPIRIETPGKTYVLRCKPPGKLLKSAHMVEREFRALRGLEAAAFRAPKALALCEDESVVGSVFYLMAHVEGRIFWDPALAGAFARGAPRRL